MKQTLQLVIVILVYHQICIGVLTRKAPSIHDISKYASKRTILLQESNFEMVVNVYDLII